MALAEMTRQCTQLANGRCITHLTHGQMVGIAFLVEGGLLSIIAVVGLFLVVIVRTPRYREKTPAAQWRNRMMTPIDIYVLSLFIADLIHGIGVVLGVRWLAQGEVFCGTYCTVQGALLQGSQTVVAFSTLAIAVHTFAIVFLKKGESSIIFSTVVVGVMWLYVILFISIAAGIHSKPDNPFYAPTPYWCWVSSNFPSERITGEYGWLWLTALVSLLLYVVLYLFLRGNIVHCQNSWIKLEFRWITQRKPVIPGSSAAKDAFIMLLYPISYICLIIGSSIVRWIDFVPQAHNSQHPDQQIVPVAVIFLAQSILALSGVVNVVLLAYTRQGLLMVEILYPGDVWGATRPTAHHVFSQL
ncbi:hypothetical protein BU17DRAFT_88014 [Hysterangium stoloniferum]|nr:hypothetical protein BU17DRAFT_88014 [Hysterangium stoloniferum]